MIRVGVSSCLLGEAVRFDGSHKRNAFILDILAPFIEIHAVCPEAELGLGVPREPIRLVRTGKTVKLVGSTSGTDHTRTMRDWARKRVKELRTDGLDGFILKSRSPSCGLHRVKLYEVRDKPPSVAGRGVFAATLARAFPDLPMEEEGRLNDAAIREHFVGRVFVHHRLRTFFTPGWSRGDLVAFHTREKILLMAHAPGAYKDLGHLVAGAKSQSRPALERDYRSGFMAAMCKRATPGRNANALSHMAGYFKTHLDQDSRAELMGKIEDYRKGLVPLVIPMTLIGHFARRFGIDDLAGQTYLEPHPKEIMPKEIMLQNHT